MKEKEVEELCEEFLDLAEDEISLNDVEQILELNENEILGIVNILKEKGINIVTVKKDDDMYFLNQGERKYENDYKYSFNTGDDHLISFLVISDPRMGSKFFQKSILNELYLHAYENGIRNIIIAGNITEGLYNMNDEMINTLLVQDSMTQAKYVVDNFPYIEGMNTYFITGKKDQTHLTKNKIDIGNQISNQRNDITYIGNKRCLIYVDNVKMLVLNRKQIKTYTQSYRAQKLIDAMRSENKPDILLYGGLLQLDRYLYRNVEVMTIPSVCASTWEMEEKEYSNTVGGIYLTIETDKKGNLKGIDTLSDVYYETQDDDCIKSKTLRRVK